MSTLDRLNAIRELVIISLFYDDDFLSLFVLKGGNALNLIYNINNRSSMDIDVSMENDFTPEELGTVKDKLHSAFNSVFNESGYQVFDFKMYSTPEKVRAEYEQFWGGYTVELKIIETEKYKQLNGSLDQIRRNATVVGLSQERKLTIDISKYEFVAPKKLTEVGGYGVYVYTPVMVIYEKLRAICQQMEEYREIVKTNRKGRARDFFDIYSVVERWRSPVDVYDEHNIKLISAIFSIKQVPIGFLSLIKNYREFHRDSFSVVQDTVNVDRLESYDFYFDYVTNMANQILEKLLLSDEEIASTVELDTEN